jgi:hypothetical protein
MTAATLRELFAGYRWLHTVAKLVHRDLEDKHVGQADNRRLCVFDLSTCVPLAAGEAGAGAPGYAGQAVGWARTVTTPRTQVCSSLAIFAVCLM